MKKIELGQTISVLAALVLGDTGVVYGHHSPSIFDTQQYVTIEGRLTRFDYSNPHGYLTVEAQNENGEPVVWELETIAALALRRRGISQDDLVVGDWISVESYPPRNSARRLASAEIITKLDGTQLVVGYQGGSADHVAPAPSIAAVASDLSGIWLAESGLSQLVSSDFNSLVTEKGRVALELYDHSQIPWANCVPYSPPAIMLLDETKLVEIDETTIVVRSQREDAVRVIYIDGREHPDDAEYSNQGHSIGHWEDDVLVVDSVHFSEHVRGVSLTGVPGGVRKHLAERFELSEDGTEIIYSYTMEDPEYLTTPVTGESRWSYRPDLEFETGTCDLEIARRFLDAL